MLLKPKDLISGRISRKWWGNSTSEKLYIVWRKETTPHLKTFAAFLEKTGRGKICYHYFDFQGKQAGQFFAQPNINIYD
jgi:hypothetical protein